MSVRRLFLHVGHAKTGTTTLQTTFRGAYDVLGQNGVLFPKGFRNHRFLRDFILGEPDAVAMEPRFRRELARTRAATGLLSSEFLNDLSPANCGRLIDYLQPFAEELTIVMYVRHPLDFARSSVQQAVRKLQRSLPEAIDRARSVPIRRYLEKWVAAAGRDNIIVREYHPEMLVDGDIVRDVLTVIGRPELCREFDRAERNVSLSLAGLLIASGLHAHRDLIDMRLDFLERVGGPPFRLPEPVRERILQQSADDVRYLAETWGLALRPPPAGEASCEAPVLTPQLAETVAEAISRVLVRRPGGNRRPPPRRRFGLRG